MLPPWATRQGSARIVRDAEKMSVAGALAPTGER